MPRISVVLVLGDRTSDVVAAGLVRFHRPTAWDDDGSEWERTVGRPSAFESGTGRLRSVPAEVVQALSRSDRSHHCARQSSATRRDQVVVGGRAGHWRGRGVWVTAGVQRAERAGSGRAVGCRTVGGIASTSHRAGLRQRPVPGDIGHVCLRALPVPADTGRTERRTYRDGDRHGGRERQAGTSGQQKSPASSSDGGWAVRQGQVVADPDDTDSCRRASGARTMMRSGRDLQGRAGRPGGGCRAG